MINLLPPKARTAVTKEYWLRVATTWSLLIAVAISIGVLFFVPSYVLLRTHLAALKTEAGVIGEMEARAIDTTTLIKEVHVFANELSADAYRHSLSETFSVVDEAIGDAVSLTAYRTARTEEGIEMLHIEGVAETREALTAFELVLESDKRFSSAEVPISDLVRGTNLPFTMTITLKEVAYE